MDQTEHINRCPHLTEIASWLLEKLFYLYCAEDPWKNLFCMGYTSSPQNISEHNTPRLNISFLSEKSLLLYEKVHLEHDIFHLTKENYAIAG